MKKRSAYLAIDFGTSNVHASVIDAETTRIIVNTNKKYGWYYPAQNQVELHIDETWKASEWAVGEVIRQLPEDVELLAITFSYFGDSITPVDEKGEALYGMIPGFCGRSFKEVQTISREIGADTDSFASGLRAALRQDPDVILVGEMRDLETISTAITAAETGHLVFGTLHTKGAAGTIDRIVDVFPPEQQEQIRIQLAEVLECIVCQTLVPRTMGGRIAAFEILTGTSAVRNLIRQNKSYQLISTMQTSRNQGMMLMDDSLGELVRSGEVRLDDAAAKAADPEAFPQSVFR